MNAIQILRLILQIVGAVDELVTAHPEVASDVSTAVTKAVERAKVPPSTPPTP